ncbi:hypothetical protein evm_002291 [Chilo suppressalis]|nr:hypothetical protein evm_002291 [Chilo suppressalis]
MAGIRGPQAENWRVPLEKSSTTGGISEKQEISCKIWRPGNTATEGETGLGAPRISYGSTNSKVGDAAFRGNAAFRLPSAADVGNLDSDVQAANTRVSGVPQGFSNPQAFEAKPERAQASYDRAANTLRFENEVGTDNYHFAFETDNGISAEENGVAADGVQAQGGFSYTGDDGQVYSVTYTADEGGYQPKGDHLPTPPPIPEEILKSLEQNARDEAAGLVDDGTYDAQKYNAGADYSESDIAGEEQNVNQAPSFGRRPVSDATASGSFINQNNQAFVRPNSNGQSGQKDEASDTQFSSNNNFSPSKTANDFGSVMQTNGLQSNGFGSKNEYRPAIQGLKQNERTQRPVASAVNDNQQSNEASESGSRFSTPQESQSSLPFGTPNRNTFNTQSFSASEKPSRGNGFESQGNSQSSTTTFDMNAGNRFASRNEYLPPMRVQSIGAQKQSLPSVSKPQKPLNQISGSGNFEAAGQPSIDFVPDTSSGSNENVQVPQSFNTFQQKPQEFQPKPQGSSNQFSSQNRFPVQKEKLPEDKETATTSLESQRPTSVPSIELTTPLESSQSNAPTNVPADRIPSSANMFNPQNINVRPSTQFGNQLTNNRQPARPSSNTQSQVSSNGFPARGQNQYPSSPSASDKQQLLQNEVSQNQPTDSQYSPSTVRPSFNQQAQAVDNSYYYRQPAKPFNNPASNSRFPSSSFGQFNGVAQQSQPQFPGNLQENFPANSFQAQRGQTNRGSTRYPEPPTLASVAPTTSFNQQFQGSTTSSQNNGITQASVSPFRPQSGQASSRNPRPPTLAPIAPTAPLGFSAQNNGMIQTSASAFSGAAPTTATNFNAPTFGSKPSFQSQYNQQNQFQPSSPNQSFGQRRPQDTSNKSQQDYSQATPTQQYSGEIYDYTKPSERLPAPSKPESTSSPQRGQTQPQFGQAQENRNMQELNTQQPTRPSFGARPQFGSQRPQFAQSTSVNADAQVQPAENAKPQFNVPSRPYGSQAQENRNSQELNTQQPNRPSFGTRPQFGSQRPQFAQSTSINAKAQIQPAEDSKPQFNVPSRPNGQEQFQRPQTPVKSQFGQNNGRPNNCCQSFNAKISNQEAQRPENSNQSPIRSQFAQPESQFPGSVSQGSSQFSGKGEVFGGPRKPPSFDQQTGYHY